MRGPRRLIRMRSRLTGVCSEVLACELRVKSAVRLVPFARFSSDGLRAPPPSVPSSTSLGVPTQPREGNTFAQIRKPFGVSRPKRGLKDITRGTQTPRRPRGVCLEPSHVHAHEQVGVYIEPKQPYETRHKRNDSTMHDLRIQRLPPHGEDPTLNTKKARP